MLGPHGPKEDVGIGSVQDDRPGFRLERKRKAVASGWEGRRLSSCIDKIGEILLISYFLLGYAFPATFLQF